MTQIQIILEAARVAAEWHSGQCRKGEKKEPYIEHLLEVAEIVARAAPENTDAIVAALLHDAIEDQKRTREEIAALFGDRAADLVVELTDDKSLPKPERKRLQVEAAPKLSQDAKLIRLADKVSNLRAVALSPPSHWENARRLEYVAWASAIAAGVGGLSKWLDKQFENARALALQSIPQEAAPPRNRTCTTWIG